MEFLFLVFGLFLGAIISKIFTKKKKKIYGHIDVDEKTGLCRVHISSDQLGDHRTKYAIFEVYHNATLNLDDVDSRDELPL